VHATFNPNMATLDDAAIVVALASIVVGVVAMVVGRRALRCE